MTVQKHLLQQLSNYYKRFFGSVTSLSIFRSVVRSAIISYKCGKLHFHASIGVLYLYIFFFTFFCLRVVFGGVGGLVLLPLCTLLSHRKNQIKNYCFGKSCSMIFRCNATEHRLRMVNFRFHFHLLAQLHLSLTDLFPRSLTITSSLHKLPSQIRVLNRRRHLQPGLASTHFPDSLKRI